MSDLFLRPLFTWRSLVASKFGPENPTTKHVLIFLSLHMSEKGDSCFPSTRLLAEETGLAQKTVVTHLAVAEKTGWVGRRDRKMPNGKGWRRVEYFSVIPVAAEARFHAKHGDNPAPSPLRDNPGPSPKREVPDGNGDYPDGNIVTTQGLLSTSLSTSKNSTGGAAPVGAAPNIEIPLVGKQGTYTVTPEKLAQWQESFPGIDVVQWLRNIRQWNIDNPGRRKTASGIEKHISQWLAKEQNRAPAGAVKSGTAPAQKEDRRCTEDVGSGEKCGMPGERFGDTFVCAGHRAKRMERKVMPEDVRLALKLRTPVSGRAAP